MHTSLSISLSLSLSLSLIVQARNSRGCNRGLPPSHSQGSKSFQSPRIDIDAYGPGVHSGIQQLMQLADLRQLYNSNPLGKLHSIFHCKGCFGQVASCLSQSTDIAFGSVQTVAQISIACRTTGTFSLRAFWLATPATDGDGHCSSFCLFSLNNALISLLDSKADESRPGSGQTWVFLFLTRSCWPTTGTSSPPPSGPAAMAATQQSCCNRNPSRERTNLNNFRLEWHLQPGAPTQVKLRHRPQSMVV